MPGCRPLQVRGVPGAAEAPPEVRGPAVRGVHAGEELRAEAAADAAAAAGPAAAAPGAQHGGVYRGRPPRLQPGAVAGHAGGVGRGLSGQDTCH